MHIYYNAVCPKKCDIIVNSERMRIKGLKKYKFLFLAIILIVFCFLFVLHAGKEYTIKDDLVPGVDSVDDIGIDYLDYDSSDCVEVTNKAIEGNKILITVRSKNPGKTMMCVDQNLDGHPDIVRLLYVHETGIITNEDFFGDYTGNRVVTACIFAFLLLLAFDRFFKLKKDLRTDMYRYRNILTTGLTFFLFAVSLDTLHRLVYDTGLYEIVCELMWFTQNLTLLTFPVIVIVSVYIMASNIKLMRKEGRTWRNMLGFILGIFMCLAALFPNCVSAFLQNTRLIDVHHWTGTGRFIGMFIENTCSILVVYFDCILIGSIVLGVVAARHVPSFDKDFIIIHGCQIRKDGTLTKLLQSRADRAIEFAKMQKESTGKDIVFIPSGGKGSDEIISEAKAISNYLLETGIPEDRILVEDRSTSTYENIKYSVELVEKKTGTKDSKIALSTTNYHVFRSGLIASEMGYNIEGIGSKTKRYFWINAFIREFIATLVSERKTHLLLFGILMLINIASVVMTYLSNVVLS